MADSTIGFPEGHARPHGPQDALVGTGPRLRHRALDRAVHGRRAAGRGGSLYPGVHKLEERGLIVAEWGITEHNRRAKFYRLTTAGKKQLAASRDYWSRFAGAVFKVLETVAARALTLESAAHARSAASARLPTPTAPPRGGGICVLGPASRGRRRRRNRRFTLTCGRATTWHVACRRPTPGVRPRDDLGDLGPARKPNASPSALGGNAA